MPGPHHTAYVKASPQPCGSRGQHYTYDMVMAISENYQNHRGEPIYQVWNVKGGQWPNWWLAENEFEKVTKGYDRLPRAFYTEGVQKLFVYENYQGKGELFVHTPGLDKSGYYALYESQTYGRDEALYSVGEDWRYKWHAFYEDDQTTDDPILNGFVNYASQVVAKL